MANLHENCDVMIDQLRTIYNKKLIKKVGTLPVDLIEKIKENTAIILISTKHNRTTACNRNRGVLGKLTLHFHEEILS